MTVIEWLPCLWWILEHTILWYFYLYVTPCPMVMCIVSTIYAIFECWYIYLALLNIYLRDPSLERKASFFLKVVFAVTLRLPFTTLGIFWVITNWHRCRGRRCKSTLGGTTKFIKDQEKDFCRQIEIFVSEEGCTFALAIPV